MFAWLFNITALIYQILLPHNLHLKNLSLLSTSETNRVGKQIRIEARLLTCVNFRKDPLKQFQSVRSLVETEALGSTDKSKKTRIDSREGIANGGSCTSIWESSVTLKSPQRLNKVDFDVPIHIDPSARASCLADWPQATPLPHSTNKRILNFTADGPLFQYKVAVAVSVFKGKSFF